MTNFISRNIAYAWWRSCETVGGFFASVHEGVSDKSLRVRGDLSKTLHSNDDTADIMSAIEECIKGINPDADVRKEDASETPVLIIHNPEGEVAASVGISNDISVDRGTYMVRLHDFINPNSKAAWIDIKPSRKSGDDVMNRNKIEFVATCAEGLASGDEAKRQFANEKLAELRGNQRLAGGDYLVPFVLGR